MPKFQFRLASVLRVRETVRDQCRVRLAESQRADAELARQIEERRNQRRQLLTECRDAALPGAVDATRLVEAHAYAERLRQDQEVLQEQRDAIAIEIAERRDALVKADREVQVLEKLEQRRRQEHRRQEDRNEGKQLDEVALRTAG